MEIELILAVIFWGGIILLNLSSVPAKNWLRELVGFLYLGILIFIVVPIIILFFLFIIGTPAALFMIFIIGDNMVEEGTLLYNLILLISLVLTFYMFKLVLYLYYRISKKFKDSGISLFKKKGN